MQFRAVVAATLFASLSVASVAEEPDWCGRYVWPTYPAECLTAEHGRTETKLGRIVAPGDPMGKVARLVIASPSRRPVATSPPATEVAATSVENSDPQKAEFDSEERPSELTVVTVWRGATPTSYIVSTAGAASSAVESD